MEWQPIETYDKMKNKPKFAVFWFEELKPRWASGISLNACANLSRHMGSRICTHWMPLPEAPTDEEIVHSVCAGFEWSWLNADKWCSWEDLRFWFHGAAVAMAASGRKEAREDFEFLRDHCAFRDADHRNKQYEADHVQP